MERDFKSEASQLCWSLFEKTGKIGYYLLFKEIEFGKNLEIDQDQGR